MFKRETYVGMDKEINDRSIPQGSDGDYKVNDADNKRQAIEDAVRDIASRDKYPILHKKLIKVYTDCIGLKLGYNRDRYDEISAELKYLAAYVAHSRYLILDRINVIYQDDRIVMLFDQLRCNGIYRINYRNSLSDLFSSTVQGMHSKRDKIFSAIHEANKHDRSRQDRIAKIYYELQFLDNQFQRRYNIDYPDIKYEVPSRAECIINDDIINSISNFSNIEKFLETLDPQAEWEEGKKWFLVTEDLSPACNEKEKELASLAEKDRVEEGFEGFNDMLLRIIRHKDTGLGILNKCLKNIFQCLSQMFFITYYLNNTAEALYGLVKFEQRLQLEEHADLYEEVLKLHAELNCFLPKQMDLDEQLNYKEEDAKLYKQFADLRKEFYSFVPAQMYADGQPNHKSEAAEVGINKGRDESDNPSKKKETLGESNSNSVNDVSMSGDDVSMSGDDVSMSGDDVSMSGDEWETESEDEVDDREGVKLKDKLKCCSLSTRDERKLTKLIDSLEDCHLSTGYVIELSEFINSIKNCSISIGDALEISKRIDGFIDKFKDCSLSTSQVPNMSGKEEMKSTVEDINNKGILKAENTLEEMDAHNDVASGECIYKNGTNSQL